MKQEPKIPDQGHYKKLYEELKGSLEVLISMFKDILGDSKRRDSFMRLVIVMMFISNILLSAALFGQGVYYQKKMATLADGFTGKMMDFVNTLDSYSTVEMYNHDSNSNELSIEKE